MHVYTYIYTHIHIYIYILAIYIGYTAWLSLFETSGALNAPQASRSGSSLHHTWTFTVAWKAKWPNTIGH